MKLGKLGIIGAGQVGSACLLSLVLRGSTREIVLVNRDRKRAEGVVTDVHYGAVLSPAVDIRVGDYSDLNGASLVMITLLRNLFLSFRGRDTRCCDVPFLLQVGPVPVAHGG